MHTDVHPRFDGPSAGADALRPIGFGGCDYLGYARHPAAAEAVARGVARSGVSSSASRTTTGNRPAHDALEAALAEFVGHEGALLLPEGFLANLAMCQALRSRFEVAVLDERSHRSLRDACVAAGLEVRMYRHLDADHASEMCRERGGGRAVVMTDGVFTADGSLAPVRGLLKRLADDGMLVTDDCHALGVIGPQGRGTRAMLGSADPRLVMTTTLAKGLGCYGGCVAGPRWVIESARRTSSAFICTTPVPPALAEASLAMLGVLERDEARLARLARNSALMRRGLNELGVGPGEREVETPIFAVWDPSEARLRAIVDLVGADGFAVPLMTYPGGPGPCYIRLSVTSEHAPGQIEGVLAAMGRAIDATRSTDSDDGRGPADLSQRPCPAAVEAAGLA